MLNVVKGPAFVVYFSRCFAVLIIENKKKKGFCTSSQSGMIFILNHHDYLSNLGGLSWHAVKESNIID